MTAKSLQDTVISRCGKTARHTNEETRSVRLSMTAGVDEPSKMRLFFLISSKGGGKTEIYVDIGPQDFAHLLEAMVDAARLPTMSAMAALLAKQLGEQPKHDNATRARGRNDLVELAKDKYENAPSDDDAAPQLVYKEVSKLAKELREQGDRSEENAAE